MWNNDWVKGKDYPSWGDNDFPVHHPGDSGDSWQSYFTADDRCQRCRFPQIESGQLVDLYPRLLDCGVLNYCRSG